MPKHRAIFRMTYEALAKWLGLPPDCEVISVSNDQNTEIASFHISSSTEEYCPSTPEGGWAMSRLVDKQEMISPGVEKHLVLKLGKYRLYRDNPEQV
jgi:hypothetical protein